MTGFPIGAEVAGDVPHVDLAPLPPLARPDDLVTLRVTAGPQRDWFDDPAEALTRTPYRATTDSDRSGVRLEGVALVRVAARADDAPGSAGVLPGAVQVPTDGQPIVFLADAPATGGYPVVAVVVADDLAAAAQCRPGQPIAFRVA